MAGGRYSNFFFHWLSCILCYNRTLFVSRQMHFCPLLQTKQVLSIPILLLFLWSHRRRVWLRGSLLLFSALVLGPTLQRFLLDSCLIPRRGGRRWRSQQLGFRMALGRAGRRCLRRGQIGLRMAHIGLRGGRRGGVGRRGRQVGLGRWGLGRGRLGGGQVGLR